jgi:putative transcriptional regulator
MRANEERAVTRTRPKPEKTRANPFHEEILESVRDAVAIAKGKAAPETHGIDVPPEMDVKAIRMSLKLSHAQFAARYGFSLASIRDWERGRAQPDVTARAYLRVIQKEREAVDRALGARA